MTTELSLIDDSYSIEQLKEMLKNSQVQIEELKSYVIPGLRDRDEYDTSTATFVSDPPNVPLIPDPDSPLRKNRSA